MSQENRQIAFAENLRDRPTPVVRDTRFGIRVLPKSDEEPSVFSYATPGRGPNGEHLS